MRLEYKTFEDAKNKFKWSERWEVFDKDRSNLNIAYECVDRHIKDKTAIRLKNSDGSIESYTFSELSDLTSKFANMLGRQGVNAGDRVGIVLNPSIEYYVSFFGTLKRGAVAVPCYSLLGPEGLGYRLGDSNAKIAIISRDRAGVIPSGLVSTVIHSEELIETIQKEKAVYEPRTSADTLALIQFSSGTTGQPKQVLYNHSAMSVAAVFTRFWLGLKEGDRYICTSSPAWGHGIWYGTVGPLIYGNGIGAFSGKFNPEMLLEAFEQFEVTVTSNIPRVYKMIMECDKIDNYDLKLRRLTYTGDGIEKEVVTYFQKKLGLYIGSTYGNTESGPIVLDYAFDDWKPRLGSAGKAILGVKIGILDEDGNLLPAGKIGQAAVWRKNEWNGIGDYGYLDEDDYFWPKGRSDDVIKSSGYRIGPFEIENVLEKHKAVERSAVIGSPDKERGEIVKAFIVAVPNVDKTEELKKDIQEFVKSVLSFHEYPKEIEFVDDLPQTPDGKLKRKALKALEYERKGKKLK
ncbi:acetate--CoA ligase [Desulfosarcina widdelii]|uniref:Acetate--CoA ligase n=1 Tax=Desulfosarcina widdelii TaxID=947919 RepID=A0A5K7ZAT1_9BACT|nr:AMP-binding protein [Desulfosarcina widdelii]BBO77835.1 acetate--CoA ligase [Desulfosarcina widdelii]